MVGFRKESFYIEKYGDDAGKQKYAKIVKDRLVRSTRRIAEIDDNELVKCEVCNKSMKRITRSHLKSHGITTKEYLIQYPNSSMISSGLKKLYSNTEESTIEKYGEELGDEKWKAYQEIQAETNTFEYKSKKYNMSKEKFDDYNKSRATTLENFIGRYGEETGIDLWDEYCERQRYTTTIDYFKEVYGEIAGQQKFDNFCLSRNLTDRNQSNLEILVFNELILHISNLDISVRLENLYFGPYDFGNKQKRKLIEFYGTYWHTDPRKYNDDFFHLQRRLYARQIKSRDQAKRTYAENNGYSVKVIWEQDWKSDKNLIIEDIKRFWNEK